MSFLKKAARQLTQQPARMCPSCYEVHRAGRDQCPACGNRQRQRDLCQKHQSGYSPACRDCRKLHNR